MRKRRGCKNISWEQFGNKNIARGENVGKILKRKSLID